VSLSWPAIPRPSGKNDFFFGTAPEMALLRIYGDIVIAVPLDRAAKRVQRPFRLSEERRDASRRFKLESVGPIRSLP
jgi:hypothetical protein